MVPDTLRTSGGALLRAHAADSKPVLIHPGSGGRSKCWPLACFLDVARRLACRGIVVCFVIGPVELECWPDDRLDSIRAGFPLIECPRPNDLLALLAAARSLLSNDSGPAHLAALLGTPTVTIFGTTSATVWRPLGALATVLAGNPQDEPITWGIRAERVVHALAARATGQP